MNQNFVRNQSYSVAPRAREEAQVGSLFMQLLRLLWKKLTGFFGGMFNKTKKLSFQPLPSLPLWSKVAFLGAVAYLVFPSTEFHFRLGKPGASASVAEASWLGGGSEFAPADPRSLRDQQNLDYVAQYKDIAIEEMERTGIPASITLAQAIIESRAGDSRLAKQLKNHFGIKCFSKKCREGHCENFTDDHHKDFFRKFKNVKDCFREHSKIVLNRRYTKRVNRKSSYASWANALEQGGYATGNHYAEKLIYVIKRYRLDKFD